MSVTRLVIGMLSLMLVPGLSSNATAAPIELDNDVSVEWGNFRCYPDYNLNACPHDAAIIGGIRLFTPGELGDLAVEIDFNTTDDEIEEWEFFLHVGDALSEQILVGAAPGVPLVLSTGPRFDVVDQVLTLADFVNGGVLPAGTLTFSLIGRFDGNSSFGECLDDLALNGPRDQDDNVIGPPDPLDVRIVGGIRVPERVCGVESEFSTDPPGTIFFTGGTAAPQQVPEPGTLILLISGLGGVGFRRVRAVHMRNAQLKAGRQSPD